MTDSTASHTEILTLPAATDIPISYIYAAMPVGFVLMLVHLLFIARGYIHAGAFAESDEMDADAAASI